MATEENKMTQDEALARAFHDNYERLAPDHGYETREDTKAFDPNSANGKLMIAVAAEIRKTVIDPAVIAGSLKMLKAHRNALYDAMPTGVELDAMDMLNIVSTHLQNVDASIAGLENALKPVEIIEKEKAAKPLERMAQEAEVVEDEQ